MEGNLAIADYFVIVTGRNRRQLRSMSDELRKLGREAGLSVPAEEAGGESGRWVLIDFGDVVVHLFDAASRSYYDLDALWADAPTLPFAAGVAAPGASQAD